MTIKGIKHAFALSSKNEPDPSEEQKMVVEKVCKEISRRHLTTPALIFLESFNAPAAVLSIAGRQFTMPIDWSLVIGDVEAGDPEVISILHINDRGFDAFCYNP